MENEKEVLKEETEKGSVEKNTSENIEESVSVDTSCETDTDTSELEGLRRQVRELSEKLEQRSAMEEKISAQIGELAELFPEVSLGTVPEEVWQRVRSGESLAASYALYERRLRLSEEKAIGVNAKNQRQSSGYAGRGTSSEYFSPDEVRAMSQKEVRANYTKIIESMKKWN